MNKTYKKIDIGTHNVHLLALPDTGIFSIEFRNDIGSFIEDKFKEIYGNSVFGLLHLAEHLSFKTTAKYSSDYILKTLRDNGTFNASTSMASLTFFYTTISENMELAMDLLTSIAYNGLMYIPTEEFEAEKEVVINEVKQYHDNSQLMFNLNAMPLLYEKDPYSNTLGSIEDLTKAILDDIIILKDMVLKNSKRVINIVYDPLVENEDNVISMLKDKLNTIVEPNVLNCIPTIRDEVYITSPLVTGRKIHIPSDSGKTLLKVVIDNSKFSIQTRYMANAFINNLSGEESLFNIIRKKHGLTYNATISSETINGVVTTIFSTDVVKEKSTFTLELFKQVINDIAVNFTEPKYEMLKRTVFIRDKIGKMDQNNFKNIFENEYFTELNLDPLRGDVEKDLSNLETLLIENTATFKHIQDYLLNFKDMIETQQYVLLSNDIRLINETEL